MNKIFSIVVGVLLTSVFTFHPTCAQSDSTSINLEGKIGLTFMVNSYFNLDAYEGDLISIKKMVDNEHAWRLGVSFSGSRNSNEVSDYSNSQYNTMATVSKMWYLLSDENIKPYYGIGLRVYYSHGWNNVPTNSTTSFSLSTGPLAYFGVEWLVSKRISFSAEYGAKIYYTNSYTRYDYNNSESSSHNFGFSEDDVRAGLTVYFSLPE